MHDEMSNFPFKKSLWRMTTKICCMGTWNFKQCRSLSQQSKS